MPGVYLQADMPAGIPNTACNLERFNGVVKGYLEETRSLTNQIQRLGEFVAEWGKNNTDFATTITIPSKVSPSI